MHTIVFHQCYNSLTHPVTYLLTVTVTVTLITLHPAGEVANAGYEGGYVERDSSRSLSEASLRSTRDALVAYRAPPETVELLRAALKQYEGL